MKKTLTLIFLITFFINKVVAQTPGSLTLEFNGLNSWTPSLPENISTVPLAWRTKTLASQLNPAQSFNMKISYAPDGMDNWGGWYTEQDKFNTFNFTNWQYVDVFIWFAGKVCIPSKLWIETAHRNGVKIIGSVFPNSTEMNSLIQKDANGKFIAAQKLIDIANYYGFDGWFFNVESSVSASVSAQFMQMMVQLQATKPAGMEIHWYDAMIPSGSVYYQNALNNTNAPLLQSGITRRSDAMFTNYWWGSSQVTTSVNTANSIGRSPFDVYTGADVWPGRTGAQALFSNSPNYTWITQLFNNYGAAGNAGPINSPKTSLGLFAMNLTYNSGLSNFNNDANDYANFYKTESRIFAGDDNNAAVTDPNGTNIWKGLGYYVPVRTVINSLPFKTNFNVGQGKILATNGNLTTKNWSNIGKQDLLPSWQWAISSANLSTNTLRPTYDFNDAYNGGSSIKFAGNLANDATVKLFQTKLSVESSTKFSLTYKYPAGGNTNVRLALYFSDDLTTPVYLNVGTAPNTAWNTKIFDLASYTGREIAVIALNFNTGTAVNNYLLSLGQVNVYNENGGGQLSTLEARQSLFAGKKNKVYPSQAKVGENVNFLYENAADSKNGKIAIYNFLGTEVYSKQLGIVKGNNEIMINLPNIQTGIYIAVISTDSKNKKEYKLLVE